MTGTTLERPDVAAYVDAVRSQLADLPTEEREDLVAEVEASLLESGEPPLLSPQEFAAELRVAAGLSPDPPAAVQPGLLDSLRSWLTSERTASWRSTARELAPIWWFARAYVVVVLLALATGQGWPVGSGTSGNSISFDESVLALLVAAAISIWLGLRGRREPGPYRRAALFLNILLALALLPVAVHSLDQLAYGGYDERLFYVEPVPGLALDGAPIRNIYAYSREGTPLFDVLLYDESGQPISVLSGDDSLRRVLRDENGIEIFNSFPVRYFEPGTTTVARPELGPPVTVPKVVTPPLELAPK